jgi:hypothetical protein
MYDDLAVALMTFGLVTPQNSNYTSILHNWECYSPSYDTLDFYAWGGPIRRQYVVVRCQPTFIADIL